MRALWTVNFVSAQALTFEKGLDTKSWYSTTSLPRRHNPEDRDLRFSRRWRFKGSQQETHGTASSRI
jgi:hypothetical protein